MLSELNIIVGTRGAAGLSTSKLLPIDRDFRNIIASKGLTENSPQ